MDLAELLEMIYAASRQAGNYAQGKQIIRFRLVIVPIELAVSGCDFSKAQAVGLRDAISAYWP